MKKIFLIFFSLSPLLNFAQYLEFKNCDDPACHEEKLHQWVLESQKEIFEFYGIAYNDDLSLELSIDDGELELEDGSAWINPDAIEMYFELLRNKVTGISGDEEQLTIQIDQEPDFYKDFPNINEGIKSKLPVVKPTKDQRKIEKHGEFNEEALKGVYRYYRKKHWDECRDNRWFPENFSATFYYRAGHLKQVEFYSCEMASKYTIPALLELKAFDTEKCIPRSFDGCTDYKTSYKSLNTNTDFENLKPQLEQNLKILASLSQPNFKINRYLLFHSLPVSFYSDPEIFNNHDYLKFYQELLAEGITDEQWWDVINYDPESNNEDTIAKASLRFKDVEKIPLWEDCDPKADAKEQQKCFYKGVIQFVGKNYIFPDNARKRGIQGRCFIGFLIEEDGSISNIEILKGLDSLTDLEAIRMLSKLPGVYSPASQNGNAVRIKYTLPLNLKLN